MRLIKPSRLLEFARRHADAHARLQAWRRVAKRARWNNLVDVRRDFPGADGVTVASGRVATVFNIGGGRYRLITAIHYNTKVVYVLAFLTHADYDKDDWKNQL